jgi:hypothetical protein
MGEQGAAGINKAVTPGLSPCPGSACRSPAAHHPCWRCDLRSSGAAISADPQPTRAATIQARHRDEHRTAPGSTPVRHPGGSNKESNGQLDRRTRERQTPRSGPCGRKDLTSWLGAPKALGRGQARGPYLILEHREVDGEHHRSCVIGVRLAVYGGGLLGDGNHSGDPAPAASHEGDPVTGRCLRFAGLPAETWPRTRNASAVGDCDERRVA